MTETNFISYHEHGVPFMKTEESWKLWEENANTVARNAGYTDRHDAYLHGPIGFAMYMFRVADRMTFVDNDGTEYVNVYEVDRVCGGPEEGGWYFDTGQIIESRHVMTHDVNRTIADLEREYPKTGDSNSVIYRGGDYRIYVEDNPGADYPEYPPHYE